MSWGDWGLCSASCGGGKRERQRDCNMTTWGDKTDPCEGPETDLKDCHTYPCTPCKLRNVYEINYTGRFIGNLPQEGNNNGKLLLKKVTVESSCYTSIKIIIPVFISKPINEQVCITFYVCSEFLVMANKLN